MELCLAFLYLKLVLQDLNVMKAVLAVFIRHSVLFCVRVACAAALLLLCSCGFHRHGYANGGRNMSITLVTSDPYGPYARAVRRELRLDGIKVLHSESDAQANTVRIELVSSSVGTNTASIFINGSTAEYEMVLDAQISIIIPGCLPVHMNIRPHKSYINYTSGALAIDAAKEIYIQEMYQQAAMNISRAVLSNWDARNSCRRAS